MSIQLVGAGGGAPFNRTFFNVSLGEYLAKAGLGNSPRLTLFLADGTQAEVCDIVKLEDEILTLRSYRRSDSACDFALQIIPYGLIYRIEIGPEEDGQEPRVGFHWKGAAKGATARRRK
jgi:hypothetical protein